MKCDVTAYPRKMKAYMAVDGEEKHHERKIFMILREGVQFQILQALIFVHQTE